MMRIVVVIGSSSKARQQLGNISDTCRNTRQFTHHTQATVYITHTQLYTSHTRNCTRHTSHTGNCIHHIQYDRRSTNKLQNGIILLIFKIWEIRYTGFVRNLIGHIKWNFYEADVIIVTSCVHRTQSVSAVFCPFFYHFASVKRYCKIRVPEKWMHSAMKPV